MTALEEYSAHHPDTVEEILHAWPWRRFEGMFRRHLMRKARDELRELRDLRLAALDANMNFDSQENVGAKQQRIDGLHEAYAAGLRILSGSGNPEPQDEHEINDDPLFAPLRKRAVALRSEASQPLVEQAGMGRKMLEAT